MEHSTFKNRYSNIDLRHLFLNVECSISVVQGTYKEICNIRRISKEISRFIRNKYKSLSSWIILYLWVEK